MDIPANAISTSIMLPKSFSVRLAEAKKAAIEAALKYRQDCLSAADLKLSPVSNTEPILNIGAVSNAEPVPSTERILNTERVSNTEVTLSTECVSNTEVASNPEGVSNTEPVSNTNVTSSSEVVSNTEPVSNTKVLKRRSDVIGQPSDVNTDFQPPVNAKPTEPLKNPTIPFKSTTPYSQLKSARKKNLPISIKKTTTRFSPSTVKSSMESSTSASRSAQTVAHPVSAQVVQTRTTRHISAWYDAVDMKSKYSRADLETLRYFITLRKKCEKAVNDNAAQDIENLFSELRTRLHNMEFYDFLTGVLICKSRILEDEGLPTIFDGPSGLYPWDIRADSRMLYQRWAVGQLDPHLFRGIDDRKITKSDGKIVKSRKFASDYANRKSPNYVGEGNLINGMWWPLQFCAMRDGAHGETEAGIHGQVGFGAYSIVVSNGGYSNIDEGDILKYCGTSGALGNPSMGTKLLMETFAMSNPIRVLRSASLAQSNRYRPAKGFRYDGLYKIIGFEILDADTVMHRFSLKRCEGQDPIRYQGVEARPTPDELVGYAKIRKLLGFT